MEYRKFGSLDFNVSALGFGCMRFPNTDNMPFSPNIIEDEAIKMLRYAIDNGVNYIDTAYPYHGGQSEVVVGKALKDGYREKVKVATKSPLAAIKEEGDFDRILDEQLKKLDVDYIDFYLLHAVSGARWENVVLKFDLLKKVEEARKAGKIKYIGFSYHDNKYENFVRVIDAFPWDFCQIQLNYLDTEYQAGINGLKYAASKGMGVIIMEPLLGGKLAKVPKSVQELFANHEVKKSPIEWAFDFLWDLKEVSVILSGMSTMEQVVENLKYADSSSINMLTQNDKELIINVQNAFKKIENVPCTKCSYCMPCPSGVDIPGNFQVYNDAFMFEDLELAKSGYKRLPAFGGQKVLASSCIGCKACETKCPQGIEISKLMPKIAETLGS